MPWSAGTFTRVDGSSTWVNDRDAAVTINAPDHDTHDQDMADGVNNALAKDGQNAATADISLGTNKLTNVGDPTAAQDGATKAYVDLRGWEQISNTDLTNGGADNLTEIDLALVAGYIYQIVIINAGCDTTAWLLSLRFQTSGGAYRTGATDYVMGAGAPTRTGVVNDTFGSIILPHYTPNSGSLANQTLTFEARIFGARDSTVRTEVIADGIRTGSAIAERFFTAGQVDTAEDNDEVRLLVSTGFFNSGRALLYRLKEPA